MQQVGASQVESHFSAWLVHLEVLGFKPGSLRAYRTAVGIYVKFLISNRIRYDEVSHQDLDRWKLELLKVRKISPGTVNYYKSAVKHFYDWLNREGYVFNSPVDRMKGVKAPRHLPKPIPEKDVTKLIEGAGTVQFRAMLEVFYGCGIRHEELRMLNVGDVDLDAGELRIMAKGGREKVVGIVGCAVDALRIHLAGKPPRDRALWLGPRGKRINQKTIRKQLKAHATAEGVQGRIIPHRLRHSFATHLLNRGAHIENIQKLLGHVKLETTMIYTEVAIQRAREELARIHPRAGAQRGAQHGALGWHESGPECTPGSTPPPPPPEASAPGVPSA